MDATDTLPDDPALLKQLLRQRNAELAQRDTMIEQIKREAADALEAQKQRHEAEVNAILRRFYGPHSERFDPRQLLLFGMVMDTMPVDQAAVEAEAGEPLKTRRIQHKHGRAKLPEALPRIPVPHDLTDQQKKCPCCGQERCCIGQEITEQLEHTPASFKVLQHIRYKYACKPCNQGCSKCDGQAHIEIAEKPAQPIDKGLPGPGLLAYVITSKLGDHLPLYRLERSPMAQAIGYMLNQWDALCLYTTQGFLNIDNNAAERAMRRIGIGRKNWLFAGHDVAAQRTATLYSLVASAERHGLDPQRYLTGVLARIAAMPVSQLEKLLPERWPPPNAD